MLIRVTGAAAEAIQQVANKQNLALPQVLRDMLLTTLGYFPALAVKRERLSLTEGAECFEILEEDALPVRSLDDVKEKFGLSSTEPASEIPLSAPPQSPEVPVVQPAGGDVAVSSAAPKGSETETAPEAEAESQPAEDAEQADEDKASDG